MLFSPLTAEFISNRCADELLFHFSKRFSSRSAAPVDGKESETVKVNEQGPRRSISLMIFPAQPDEEERNRGMAADVVCCL